MSLAYLAEEFWPLVPHTGDWRAARVPQLAAELNAPPTTLLETYQPGPLPTVASYVDASSDAVLVGVIKGAEDGGEVRTFFVPADADTPVTEVNLLEWTDQNRSARR